MRNSVRTACSVLATFVLAGLLLVHSQAGDEQGAAQAAKAKTGSAKKQQSQAAPGSRVEYGADKLPAAVIDMREAILAAVHSGRIEDLRHAFELNELKPDLGADAVGDPVAHWKRVSGDGQGREVLAALAQILDAGYVTLPLGRDPENNRIYIWPYFAEMPLGNLTPGQQVELLRLVSPVVAKDMMATGKYTYWRIAIGADGTWHSFRK